MTKTRVRKGFFVFVVSVSVLLLLLITAINLFQYILISKPTTNEISAQENIDNAIDELRPVDSTGESSENPSVPQTIYRPKTSYEIMDYAFSLLPKYENIVITTTTVAGKNILGKDISQKMKIVYYRSKNVILEENFAYGFETLYRFGYTEDGVNCKFLRCDRCDENLNRTDITGLEVLDLTRQEINEHHQSVMFVEYLLIPDKTRGSIVSFDRVSDDDFYIIKFDFSNLPAEYIKSFKDAIGADSITFHSTSLIMYINKNNYQLSLISRVEDITFSRFGVDISIGSSILTTMKYPEHLELEIPH